MPGVLIGRARKVCWAAAALDEYKASVLPVWDVGM